MSAIQAWCSRSIPQTMAQKVGNRRLVGRKASSDGSLSTALTRYIPAETHRSLARWSFRSGPRWENIIYIYIRREDPSYAMSRTAQRKRQAQTTWAPAHFKHTEHAEQRDNNIPASCKSRYPISGRYNGLARCHCSNSEVQTSSCIHKREATAHHGHSDYKIEDANTDIL